MMEINKNEPYFFSSTRQDLFSLGEYIRNFVVIRTKEDRMPSREEIERRTENESNEEEKKILNNNNNLNMVTRTLTRSSTN